jgi:ABC-2 type transport system permease protein
MTTYKTFRPAIVLSHREIIRFFRQKSRIVGVLLTPILFWIVLGFGFGESFKTVQGGVEVSYLEYFFPGIVTLVILFAAVFSNISLIEDRNEGFLQSVLIAPISSVSIVSGKVAGGVIIALFQGMLLYFVSPFAGIILNPISFSLFLLSCALTASALSALGFFLAWKINSVQGFHSIMNVGLIPLWLLSGAVFPIDNSPGIIHYIMIVNPLSYGVGLIKYSLYADTVSILTEDFYFRALLVTFIFLVICILLASKTVARTRLE